MARRTPLMSRQRVFFVFVLSPRLFLLSLSFPLPQIPFFPGHRIDGFRCLADTGSGLAPNMTGVVPQPDYRLRSVVFVTQRTQARCAQQEVSTECGIEPEPARGEYSQEMPAGEKQHVTFDTARAFHRAVRPRANLFWRFPSGAAIPKQLPIRALPVNVSGKATLILAIVPFEQVPVDFSYRSKSRQLAGPHRALQRAGKHLGESHSAQPFLKPAGIALAAFCERQVGKARVLARERPRGFPVPGQVNDRKHFAHRFIPLACKVLSLETCS